MIFAITEMESDYLLTIALILHCCLEVISCLKAFATMLTGKERQTSEEMYPGKSWWLVKESAQYQGVAQLRKHVEERLNM
jgi:hypothetical protein